MPIQHRIDRERRRMETVATGPVSWSDLQKHWTEELADGAEGYPELVDGSAASVDFTAEDVRRLVEVLRLAARTGPLGPTAVVVRTDLGFGMVRMFGMLVEPFCEIVPFRDRVAAEAWLEGACRRSEPLR